MPYSGEREGREGRGRGEGGERDAREIGVRMADAVGAVEEGQQMHSTGDVCLQDDVVIPVVLSVHLNHPHFSHSPFREAIARGGGLGGVVKRAGTRDRDLHEIDALFLDSRLV